MIVKDKQIMDEFYEINRDAAIEMSYKPRPSYIARCRELGIKAPQIFYDPKIRSLHIWLARRPRSIARLTIPLALDMLGNKCHIFNHKAIAEKVLEGYAPLISFTKPPILNKKVILCDPMAGGGTIPLESVLQGINTIAFDYNPVAYLILKGTIEYPVKFKEKLSEIVRQEAKKLIEYAKTTLSRFYNIDDDAYIITKSVTCPFCREKIMLIQVSNINVENASKQGRIVKRTANFFDVLCLSCGKIFRLYKKNFWEVWANKQIQIWSLIFSGKVDYDLLFETHPILIKKKTNRQYTAGNREDNELLANACEFLAKNINDLKKYIPTDEIYTDNRVFSPIREYGIRYWYQIFNPRQLLALALLTKYIRKRQKELLFEHGEFGAAISLYLSYGLSKMVDFNTILTTWNQSNKSIRDTAGQYARSRKVELRLEYCEAVVPYKNLPWVFEPDINKNTAGGICPVLDEICKQMKNINSNVKVFQFDVKRFPLLGKNFVDIVNVDPPYFDQHIYSDLSDFFWIVLKGCLEDSFKRFFFNEEIKGKKSWEWIDWEPSLPYVPRQDELIIKNGNQNSEVKKYRRDFTQFLLSTYQILKNDGKLVLWFTHKSWRAWESILYAIYLSGFNVIGFYPFVSEHPTRSVTMQGEPKLNRTIVIIACKHPVKVKEIDEDIFVFCSKVYQYLDHAKIMPNEKIQLWEKALTLLAASTARLTALKHGRETSFERGILPEGIGLGLISLLRIMAMERGKDIKKTLKKLRNIDKAKILIYLIDKLFGSTKVNLIRYVYTFCQVSKDELKISDKENREIEEILNTFIPQSTQN